MEKYIYRLEKNKDLNGILIEVGAIKNAISEIMMIRDCKMEGGNRLNLLKQLDELEDELIEAEEVKKRIVAYHNRINNLLLKY